MLLTNHVLTGSLLGLVIDEPLLLAPTAFASHFFMDGLPHFGHPTMKSSKRSWMFLAIGSLDFLAACTVVGAFCVLKPQRAGHIALGAFCAAFPDLLFIPEILFGRRFFKKLFWVHSYIQWSETPPGLITEGLWASVVLYLIRQRM